MVKVKETYQNYQEGLALLPKRSVPKHKVSSNKNRLPAGPDLCLSVDEYIRCAEVHTCISCYTLNTFETRSEQSNYLED